MDTGHVRRKPTNNITRVHYWTPEGKKPFNLRTHGGGPWKRNERKKKLTWGELEKVTQDRDQWSSLLIALCAHGHSNDQVLDRNVLEDMFNRCHFVTCNFRFSPKAFRQIKFLINSTGFLPVLVSLISNNINQVNVQELQTFFQLSNSICPFPVLRQKHCLNNISDLAETQKTNLSGKIDLRMQIFLTLMVDTV